MSRFSLDRPNFPKSKDLVIYYLFLGVPSLKGFVYIFKKLWQVHLLEWKAACAKMAAIGKVPLQLKYLPCRLISLRCRQGTPFLGFSVSQPTQFHDRERNEEQSILWDDDFICNVAIWLCLVLTN